MKKNILIIFILSSLFTSSLEKIYATIQDKTIESLLKIDFNFDPERFSNYVFKRYYFIKRLKRSIDLFNKINKNIKNHNHSINTGKLFEFDSSIDFRHYRIKNSIEQIKKKQNFKPLFVIWQDFAAYKSLDDQLFIEEFTKEIFVISKNIFLNAKPTKTFFNLFLSPEKSLGTQEMLDEIDKFTDGIMYANLAPTHTFTYTNKEIKPLAHINDIIMHFYYIKRLAPSNDLLSSLYSKGYVFKEEIIAQKRNIVIDSINFYHPKIITCVKAIRATSCLKPLLLLLNQVKQYRYIQDKDFIRELLLLIFLIDKQIIMDELKDNTGSIKKSALTTIIAISNTIDQLPISELLNTIDMLVEELPIFLAKYEFNSTMTWKKWLRKYWWVPPILIGWFGLKILLKFQHKPYFNQGLYQPKPPIITTTDPALLELIRDKS